MKPARAKSFFAGPLKYLGQSLNVANRSEKFKYSGYCQGEGLFKVGGEIFFTGRVTYLVFNFSSLNPLFESDKFHEKLALESIPHDVDGKQSKEHASVLLEEKLGQESVSIMFSLESIDDIVLRQGSREAMIKKKHEIAVLVICVHRIVFFTLMITNQIS